MLFFTEFSVNKNDKLVKVNFGRSHYMHVFLKCANLLKMGYINDLS